MRFYALFCENVFTFVGFYIIMLYIFFWFGVFVIFRLSNVKVPLGADFSAPEDLISRELGIAKKSIFNASLYKKSVDARKKSDVHFICAFDFDTTAKVKPFANLVEVNKEKYAPPKKNLCDTQRIVVVGSGPAGLFCALTLLNSGAKVTLLERGEPVEQRALDIAEFQRSGKLNIQSNIQFGEGGAGTFSDGKLNTGIKNPRCRYVLERLAEFCDAPDILYDAKPHIGTDRLVVGVKNIRKAIVESGGEVLFSHRLVDVDIKDEKIKGVLVQCPDGEKYFECEHLVLAIGHSARDTFYMLYDKGLDMCRKPFSVGVRVEHPQILIDKSQYAEAYIHPALAPADYKLSCHLKNGRGVYSFCMCPGGTVVAAASEEGMVCTNGMSTSQRDGENANSALLVSVEPEDFEGEHPLAGVEFQRKIERDAFVSGKGNMDYCAPVQLLGDFLKNRASEKFGSVAPSYLPDTKFVKLEEYLPDFVTESLRLAIPEFAKKIKGFDLYDAILCGPEARSSSPVRIIRDENLLSNISGIYPCGEGAGYAGGITSAAVDGIKVAESIIEKIKMD